MRSVLFVIVSVIHSFTLSVCLSVCLCAGLIYCKSNQPISLKLGIMIGSELVNFW